MDDIEDVIDASRHFKYSEAEDATLLNKLSSLPESKKRLKRAIKERMSLLAASYVSLATFVADEDAEYAAKLHCGKANKRLLRIFMRVGKEMNKLKREIRDFDPLL